MKTNLGVAMEIRSRKDQNAIAREDILRFLLEKKEASKKDIIQEVGDEELTEKNIQKMINDNLIRVTDNTISLTPKGEREAKLIYEKYKIIENVLKKYPISVRRQIAHFIEHIDLGPEDLLDLDRFLEGAIKPLVELDVGEEARILTIINPKPHIVARLYGVGLLSGTKIEVLSRTSEAVILVIKPAGRVVSLDKQIAEKILVVKKA
jgi:Mn-dependent DtxR family transcriptional regulator/Fe2+ transport system protein FeoA